ncbi:MAG: AAA family ATPase [Flavobacterium sp.]
MLKEIKFKNYKAFETGSLKIKPITILLGANSIGKSSILQFLLMLQQTALAKENYKAALKLHGGFLSLGEGKNIFRKHNIKKPVSINLIFEDESLIREFSNNLLREKIGEIYEYARLTDNIKLNFKEKISPPNEEIKSFQKIFSNNRYSRNDFKIDDKILSSLPQILDYSIENTRLIKKKNEKEFLSDFYLFRINHTFRNIENKKKEIEFGLEFIQKFSALIIKDSKFSIEFDIYSKENVLQIKSFILSVDSNIIFKVDLEIPKDQNFSFSSPLFENQTMIKRINDSIKKYFIQPKTIFSFIDYESVLNPKNNEDNLYIIDILINIMTRSLSSIESYFDEENVNYVSPLRAHPKRYYFLDKAKINTYLDTLDGDALAETLKDDEDIKRQVNEWLSRFNLNVEVNKLEDILHKLTVNQNSLSLDITDVGFGISQVLPVIIQGFLSYENSITLIEQPEIHLHPKMQADLADLFIDIAIQKNGKNNSYKNLIIETHSEYLIRRLRRRISEGKLSTNDIAIYLIKKNTDDANDNSIIEELNIEEKGNFEYPIEFYGGELLKDETVFLKNQI